MLNELDFCPCLSDKCSVAVGYQYFGGPCCNHLQSEVRSRLSWTCCWTYTTIPYEFLSCPLRSAKNAFAFQRMLILKIPYHSLITLL